MGVIEDLRRARQSYESREWVAAYRALSELEGRRRSPGVEDFAALATTAYLLGRRDDCIHALQRAYQAGSTAGDRGPRCAPRTW